MKEKILIENGTIIDGTGSKEYVDTILMEKGVINLQLEKMQKNIQVIMK